MTPPPRLEAGPAPISVDVVILSWERVECTIAAVESALAQQHVAVKVIIVDQGSSEATLEQLRATAAARSAVVLHELGRNVGIPAARNIGIALGSAELIVGLDNDAVLAGPGALEIAVERFRANAALAAIGFRVVDAATGELDLFSWGYSRPQLAMADRAFTTTRFVGGAHACRRSAFEAAGRYDPRLFICWEEIDLCFRLINLGYEIIYEPTIIVVHMKSPSKRFDWSNERYYYFVRNRIYVEYKCGTVAKAFARAIGYVIKGAINGLLWPATRACFGALTMCWRTPGDQRLHLTAAAKAYIHRHERTARGSRRDRLRNEVLAKLP